jgi:SP family arabinose:H+ symporter-like MFS transporter
MYYAPVIFESVGTSRDSAFLQTVVVGVVNVIFTFVAIGMVDRAGRRFLLLTGSAVQVVALAGVGWMFQQGIGGWPLMLCLLLFIAAFAMAMGPVPWIVISEIFPTKVRGRAMSVAVFVLWTSCYVVSQSFPVLREQIGIGPTFWFYGLCSLFGLFFVALFVPETKGRTLEEIEQQWRKRHVSPID